MVYLKCRICGNEENNKEYKLQEMHFGTREEFNYFECDFCKCIQISEIPDDMSVHYPTDYYTSAPITECDFSKHDKSIEELFILRSVPYYCQFLQNYHPKDLNASFLDVGCGSSQQIRILGAMGFKKAIGIDPFLHKRHVYDSDNCKVFEANIFDINDKFDYITFIESFGNMEKPKEVLLKTQELLNDDGICFIKIPYIAYAWHLYGINWFRLDAPRAFFFYTRKSLELLFEQTGFEIISLKTTSEASQFIFSELNKRGMPLVQVLKEGHSNLFKPQDLKLFEKMSEMLNEKAQGDIVEIYIKKKGESAIGTL